MMKFILLAIAFIALFIQPTIQLTCYECKSQNYQSSWPNFNSIQICDKDQENWPTRHQENNELNFEKCKKIVEKVNINNKSEVLIIRTIGKEDMQLDKKIFTEYTCNTDLCNNAVTTYKSLFVAFLSVITTLTIYL